MVKTGNVMCRILFQIIVYSVLLSLCCSNDKGINPEQNNEYEIISLQLLFKSRHYNNMYYDMGDTVEIRMVETPESELPDTIVAIPLPDSVEITLTSELGDEENIMLMPGGGWLYGDNQGCSCVVYNKSLMNKIPTAGASTAIHGNGILEVDSHDQITATFVNSNGGRIRKIISVENLRKEVVNGEYYEFWNGRWFINDEIDFWYEVISDKLSVLFKENTSQEEIDSFNHEMRTEIGYVGLGGFMTISLPEGSDPIEMLKLYLESDIVEIAEVFTYGCVIS